MTEFAYFFDAELVDGDPDITYQTQAWADIYERLVSDGYVPEPDVAEPLQVVPTDPESMAVDLGAGALWIQGRFYLNDGEEDPIDIAPADPSNDRIDRVIVELDIPNRVIAAKRLTGTAAADPAAPALTRNDNVYQMSLAQLLISAGSTSVGSEDITDERDDDTVCGEAQLIAGLPTHGNEGHDPNFIAADGSNSPTADIDWGGNSIINAAIKIENVEGAAYTVVAADAGKVKRFTEAGLVTVTLPDGLAVGHITHLLAAGAGGLSIQSNASSTVEPHDPGTVAQHGEASALVVATDTWNVQGTEEGS